MHFLVLILATSIAISSRMLQRGESGDKNANAKQKWFEEKQKRKHAELERLGLDKSDMHRIETAEQVRMLLRLSWPPRAFAPALFMRPSSRF